MGKVGIEAITEVVDNMLIGIEGIVQVLDDFLEEFELKAGDVQTVLRGQKHSFTSKGGAIFEEVSTTHIKNDSYYDDPKISKLDPMERKTVLRKW